MNNYIAINRMRSSTSHGFFNTWSVYKISKEDRKRILAEGLPCKDIRYMDGSPCFSKIGIRSITSIERAKYLKELENNSYAPEAYFIDKEHGWNFTR